MEILLSSESRTASPPAINWHHMSCNVSCSALATLVLQEQGHREAVRQLGIIQLLGAWASCFACPPPPS